jgi:hypothetical protein
MLRTYAFAAVILGCGAACTPAKKEISPQQQEKKDTGVISGTVVNERGEPVPDVTVKLGMDRPI